MINREDIIQKISEIERLTKELKTLERKLKYTKQEVIDEMSCFLLPLGYLLVNGDYEKNGAMIHAWNIGSNSANFFLHESGMNGLGSATWKFKRESFETFYKKIIKV